MVRGTVVDVDVVGKLEDEKGSDWKWNDGVGRGEGTARQWY